MTGKVVACVIGGKVHYRMLIKIIPLTGKLEEAEHTLSLRFFFVVYQDFSLLCPPDNLFNVPRFSAHQFSSRFLKERSHFPGVVLCAYYSRLPLKKSMPWDCIY